VSDAAAQRRARQTVINLALSLLATLGLVLAIVLMVPRDDTSKIQRVNCQQVAGQVMDASMRSVVLPQLPKGWWCNKATWSANPVDTVPVFKAGFVGPNNEYIGFIKGFNANPTWLALKLQSNVLTGTQPGVHAGSWSIYQSPEKHDPAKDWDYAMVYTADQKDYIILYGNGTPEQFSKIASSADERATVIID
jgi:hypothetical protein